MWNCPDNQEVGLEAATLQRKRNSSLVEWGCAENSTGLKHATEATDGKSTCIFTMVGEHCSNRRRYTVRSAGGTARAYADTSSEKEGEKPSRRKPKVSCSQVNLLRVSRPLSRGREA
jgi:hypothetical protein